jgi:hypothetical protein
MLYGDCRNGERKMADRNLTMSTPAPLITEDGELDFDAMGKRAHSRAVSEWGSLDYPTRCRRQASNWVYDRACAEQRAWRRDRGLPDDSAVSMVDVAEWGASGDGWVQ